VTGFLKGAGGGFDLADVKIDSQNDYATVQVVSMDGKPIATSKKLLVQIGTTERLTGYETKPVEFQFEKQKVKGEEITNTGHPPRLIANTSVKLTLKKTAVTTATLLDVSGYAVKEIPVKREGSGLTVDLPANAMYVVLR
jgi:hypothetical protein